jgi:hypothetical protein
MVVVVMVVIMVSAGVNVRVSAVDDDFGVVMTVMEIRLVMMPLGDLNIKQRRELNIEVV